MNFQSNNIGKKRAPSHFTRFWGRRDNRFSLALSFWVFIAIFFIASLGAAEEESYSIGSNSLDEVRLSRIDDVVKKAIGRKKLPGAVVLVGLGDPIPLQEGNRQSSIVSYCRTHDR